MNNYSWADITPETSATFAHERPILILGARDISEKRIQQLTAQLLAKKAVVWGCFTEKFITGLENSPQFQTLSLTKLKKALTALDQTGKNPVATLLYSQTDSSQVIKAVAWSAVIGINGSWHRAFHYRDEFQTLTKNKIPYKLVSSFVDETEALAYDQAIKPQLPQLAAQKGKKYSHQELMSFAQKTSLLSFDYTFQTGAVLAKDNQFLLSAHNQVVPYETYMLHQGATKEKLQLGVQDTSVYDTNHAEVELLVQAMKNNINLADCSLFINLLPCPVCTKMLARTGLKEIIYQHDHSDGYAKKILEKVGIKVTLYSD